MRAIKFRGIGKRTGTWIYGNLIQIGGVYIIIPIYDEYEVVPDHSTECVLDEFDVIEPDSLGQFTGLLDKNGKEIYEGDIVNVRVTNDRFRKNPRFRNDVVTFCEYDGGWMVGCYYRFLPKRMEVIGNIHDNPELMKREAK